jgi:hypothetical protein
MRLHRLNVGHEPQQVHRQIVCQDENDVRAARPEPSRRQRRDRRHRNRRLTLARRAIDPAAPGQTGAQERERDRRERQAS